MTFSLFNLSPDGHSTHDNIEVVQNADNMKPKHQIQQLDFVWSCKGLLFLQEMTVLNLHGAALFSFSETDTHF